MDKRVLRKSVGSSFAALALVGTLGLTPVLAQEPTTTTTPVQTEAAKPEEWSFTGSIKVPDDLLAQLKAGKPGRGHEHGQGPRHKDGCDRPAPRDDAQATEPKADRPAPKDDAQATEPKTGEETPAPKDDAQATEPKTGEETPAPKDDAQATVPKADRPAPKDDAQATEPKDDAQAQDRNSVREQLQALATVTADEAEQAALAGFSGATAGRVDLRPINGYLVYSVHLTDEQGQHQEVIVDAGNAQVLASRAAPAKAD